MTRRLAAVAVVVLVPVVLLAAAVGALGGGSLAALPAGASGAVGLAESGGQAHRHAGSTDRGAWQLNTCYHPEVTDACAFDLACAAEATDRTSAGGSDWTAWTTCTSGAYRARLGAADQALAAPTTPSAAGGVHPAMARPAPCGLSPATDYAKHLVTWLFGISDIGGCALFTGHVETSDHYPEKAESSGLLKALWWIGGGEFAELAPRSMVLPAGPGV